MKTPKRTHCDIYKCPKCEGYGITFIAEDCTSALFQCSLCGTRFHMAGLPKRTRAIRARWIRKNREARLKHAISALARLLTQSYENFATVAGHYYSLRERYEAHTGCHGQDVEGS